MQIKQAQLKCGVRMANEIHMYVCMYACVNKVIYDTSVLKFQKSKFSATKIMLNTKYM